MLHLCDSSYVFVAPDQCFVTKLYEEVLGKKLPDTVKGYMMELKHNEFAPTPMIGLLEVQS